MGTNYKPVNNTDQAAVPEPTDRAPESRFTDALILTDLGLFSVYYSVIGPIAEDPKYRVPLPRRQAERMLEEIADLVKSLEEQLRR